MDARGIAMQLLSSPSALDGARARAWNEQTAAMVAQNPSRLGLLAALAMAHPDAALAELSWGAPLTRWARTASASPPTTTASTSVTPGSCRSSPSRRAATCRCSSTRRCLRASSVSGWVGPGRCWSTRWTPHAASSTRSSPAYCWTCRTCTWCSRTPVGRSPPLVERITLLGVQPWTANPRGLSGEQLRGAGGRAVPGHCHHWRSGRHPAGGGPGGRGPTRLRHRPPARRGWTPLTRRSPGSRRRSTNTNVPASKPPSCG